MIKRCFKWSVFIGLMLFDVQVVAAPIPIENSSFESPYLSDGQGSFSIPGWAVFDTDAGIASHITNPTWYPLNQLEIEGQNALIASGGEYVYQALTVTLVPDTLYTLTVDVGNVRSRIGGMEYYWAGYAVELWAGDTLLSSDDYTLHPTPSHFLTSSISYQSTSSDPLLGELLEIRLMSLGDSAKFLAFDDVELDATTVPLPGSISLLLIGLGFIQLARRKKDEASIE